jgi:hypothetical protein
LSSPEEPRIRKKLIAENWREQHEILLAELTEENRTQIDIHTDLCNLLMWDISGLRIAQMRLSPENNGEIEALGEQIAMLKATLEEEGKMPEEYWNKSGADKVDAKDFLSYLHQSKNPILRTAVAEAEALLARYGMVPIADPDRELDEMILKMGDINGND